MADQPSSPSGSRWEPVSGTGPQPAPDEPAAALAVGGLAGIAVGHAA
jgi:hypothetical protein